MPTGNLANVTALDTNNPDLVVPEKHVRAGYIDGQPGGNIMKLSDISHPPMFLMIGNYTNGKMLVQTTGFLNMPNGHDYIPLTQYYADENGVPTTNGEVTGQKLFLPLDEYTISVNGDF